MIFIAGLVLVLLAPFMAAIDPSVYWWYVGIGFGVAGLGAFIELWSFFR